MNKKQFFSRSAAFALSAAILTSSLTASAVTDIKGHWAESNIQKWIDAGIINGYQDDTFKPNNNITRAEFAVILAKVLNDPTVPTEHRFSDVKEGTWYYDAVNKLCSLGVVSEADKFNPNSNITRQDVIVMASRALRISSSNKDVLNKFSDADKISDYAVYAVAGFVEKGYTNGYSDGTIRPLQPITRAECIKLLDPLGLVADNESLAGIMKAIYNGVKTQMPPTTNTPITSDNVEYFLGLKSMDGIEEALASDAMMTSTAHSVCLVRVKDGTDVSKMMEDIKNNVNPQKWICVGVDKDQVIVKNQGNLILLVMDSTAPQEIADSFMALNLGGSSSNPDDSQKPDDNPNEKPEDKPEQTPDTDKPVINSDGLIQYGDFYMDHLSDYRPNYVENFAKKLESINEQYLKGATNVYYTVVPSKQYFINDKLEKPFDYTSMMSTLTSNIKNIKQIDLTGTLTLDDYLKTDPHWKQDGLQKVVDKLGESMGFKVDLSTFKKNTVDGFIGQHGYDKQNFPSEKLTYLTDDATENAVVDNFQDKTFTKVYNLAKLETKTPYDVFLSGSTPLITITNPNAKSDKELVMFRDSYSSSLAPLLIDQYKTITMVDLRYMASSLIPQYVDANGKDVLFIFNDQVINTVNLR